MERVIIKDLCRTDFQGLNYNPFMQDLFKEEIDKTALLNMLIMDTLNQTQEMFEWKVPSKNIKQRDMELMIQTRGYSAIIKEKGEYYCLYGGLGGEPNFNYMPSLYIVANPYLRLNKMYKVYYDYETQSIENEEDYAVVIPNDAMYVGLLPKLNLYLSSIIETRVSRRIATINARALNILTAMDDNTRASMKDVISDLYKGKTGVILTKNLLNENGAFSIPFSQNSSARTITELIEAEQYDKASLYNSIGLQANYNMKRESINSNEAQLNEDAILPYTANLLNVRQEACERLKTVFGGEWSVDYSSAWKFKMEEIEAVLDNIDNMDGTQSIEKGEEDNGENDISYNKDGEVDDKSGEQ